MKKAFMMSMMVVFSLLSFGQSNPIDSLKLAAAKAKDTTKVNLLLEISSEYTSTNPAEAINFARQAQKLAAEIDYKKGEAYAYKNIGLGHYIQGDYLRVLDYWQKSLRIFQSISHKTGESNLNSNLGAVYFNYGDYAQALEYYLESLRVAEKEQDKERIAIVLSNIGAVYEDQKKHQKALQYYLKAFSISTSIDYKPVIGTSLVNIGSNYLAQGRADSALSYFEKAIIPLKEAGNMEKVAHTYANLGKGHTFLGNYAESMEYHKKALETAQTVNAQLEMAESFNGIGENYLGQGKPSLALGPYLKARNIAKEIGSDFELKTSYQGLAKTYAGLAEYANAYRYQALLTAMNDTLYNAETSRKIGNLQALYENEKQQAEIDLLTKDKALQQLVLERQKTIRNALLIGIALILIFAFVQFRNYKMKKEANQLLALQNEEINQQKEEIEAQRDNLEQTYNHLKSTQSQLIQAEKMASLGELTAGIAHEIQNPLNFVNNFSELNIELIAEMKEELAARNFDEVKLIANDIAGNQEKIKNHGKRADAIVKGMLLHSRRGSGVKEPTAINALTEEYMRLAYQGLRAKDKSFNVTLKTEFDERIGKIDIIPEDFSRVILNLLTNAFYAVRVKEKAESKNYEPVVKVITQKIEGKVSIFIEDNGNGIPAKIMGKIFQPFFTTKPTGEGTGLGLSMAYDIVKAHGGELNIDSVEGVGTSVTILLPLEKSEQISSPKNDLQYET